MRETPRPPCCWGARGGMVEESKRKKPSSMRLGTLVFVRREERESEHHHFCVFLNFDEQRKPFAAPSFFSFLSAAGFHYLSNVSTLLSISTSHLQQHQQQHPSEETWPVRRPEREREGESREGENRESTSRKLIGSLLI